MYELGSGLGKLVWFVVDEYYCSETTTTQACLGMQASLGCLRATKHTQTDDGQPARNSCPPFAWFALHTLFFHVQEYNVKSILMPVLKIVETSVVIHVHVCSKTCDNGIHARVCLSSPVHQVEMLRDLYAGFGPAS